MTLGALAVSAILGAAPALAATNEAIHITHTPHPCVLAGRTARVEARIEPARDDVRARVRFRSEGTASFYSVPMQREGDAWVGVLPAPAEGTKRIAYFIDVDAGGSRHRVPASSAYVVDVVGTPCPEGALPVSTTGPKEIGVPAGAPRIPPGFEGTGIVAYVEEPGDGRGAEAPARPASVTPLAVQPIAPGTKVRAVTSQDDRRREGKLVSVDSETLVLDTGQDRVRIRRDALVSLEVREKGSSGMRVLGGLGGAVAGIVVTALICASADACDSVGVFWAGTAVGAVGGALLVGNGSWKPVTLATAGPVALDLQVRQAAAEPAAGVRLRVGF